MVIKNITKLKSRQTLGKFRIRCQLAQGGFADVYRAYDTVEGIHVALKILHPQILVDSNVENFAKEVRIVAQLDHPNILHIKTAYFIGDHFVIVYPLGEKTLGDCMTKRLPLGTALDYTQQMLEAVAFAHDKRVIHCDIKPDNFILFSGGRLKLTDFGIAKIASRYTINASGSGTVGYVAPEQALGKPSLSSDVFSLGLIIWEMLTGKLPSWPYEWPLPGHEHLRGRVHPDFINFLRKSLEVNVRKRFPSAVQMLSAYRPLQSKAKRTARRKRRRTPEKRDGVLHLRQLEFREFRRQYGKQLGTHLECKRCGGPMSESMKCCPWCGRETKTFHHETRFPVRCRSCKRGMKLDWRFCPHCYGGLQGPHSGRSYSDVRYEARCQSCKGELMRFMHYCPWCRAKIHRKWRIEGTAERCSRCGWGILHDFWSYCPWCLVRIRT